MTAPQRKIVHVDMDCFYAAVELLDRPDLKGKPVAVGGHPDHRGVLTTCNYVARRFGVRSAQSSLQAVRLCPQLIILPPRFHKYKAVSGQVHNIYRKYTSHIEPLSLDEAYLDLTDSPHFQGQATATARAIRKDIFETLGLTASAGISNSKFLAKVASDWNKPNGQKTIAPHQIQEFMKSLPVGKIPGVGKATGKRLQALQVKTCGDLQKYSLTELSDRYGRFGERLYDLCRGVDHSRVKSQRKRKSISVETTLSQDLNEWHDIQKEIAQLYQELRRRMERAQINEKDLRSLVVKFKTSEFNIHSHESAVPLEKNSFVQLASELFQEHGGPIRLIGIGCRLAHKNPKKKQNQLELFQTI